jgi:acetyltransferase-like isoleucine patch superfamily enzyme
MSLFVKIKKKLLKALAKNIPGNGLRLSLLRKCNYQIGKDVYIGEDLIVIDELGDPSTKLIIEDRVAISPRVTLVIHSAPNDSRIRKYIREQKSRIVIHQDAWIGTGVVIMPGVEVGEGSVVGSNAVVTKSVPDYTVVAGIPARIIKTVEVPWFPRKPQP